jgi:hypothetical protein
MSNEHSFEFKKYFTACFIFPALVLLFFSCATRPDSYNDIDIAVYNDNFIKGIEEIRLRQNQKKPLYAEKNSILLYLDKGLLEHYAKNYVNSSQDLQEAERLIQEAFTKSITASAASYIANDNTKDYPGEDYEDIYINVINAMNYYHDGDLEGAMVEIRKITMTNGKLDQLATKYEGATGSASQYFASTLSAMGLNVPQLPDLATVSFNNSALARYLSALFYQGQGKDDDARIEFEQVSNAFNTNPNVYYNSIPKSVTDAQNVPQEKGRLNVIGFSGLGPAKEEFSQTFPVPFFIDTLQIVQLKLPVLAPRPSSIDRIQVEVNGQGSFDLELLEDMGAVTTETFKARSASIVSKTFIRTLVKYATGSVASAAASDKAGGGIGGALASLATSLASKVVADASEAADIRMGRYFPDKAYIGGINLDPGTYSGTVTFYSGGRVVARDDFKDVNVRANRLNLVETISLR